MRATTVTVEESAVAALPRPQLFAPFPWFGGKSRIARAIWDRLGDVPNYVEPFLGSAAILLARPHAPRVETVNDADGFIANFWRAVSSDAEEVAYWADWPVSEIDLHARHAYLVQHRPDMTERLQGDPSYCDPKLAGWWVWGQCSWIGTGWCSGEGPWIASGGHLVHRDELGDPGQGINRQLPHLSSPQGINRQLPHLGNPGRGINRQLPHLSSPRGINRKLPHLGNPGRGMTEQGTSVLTWMLGLQERMRKVRVACGDWSRVADSNAVTWRHGITGIVLDPPYKDGLVDYAVGSRSVGEEVEEWCRRNGSDERLRIALCGYEGDHELDGWSVFRWTARGGYGNKGKDDNRHRECIWFSPGCLPGVEQRSLFDPGGTA